MPRAVNRSPIALETGQAKLWVLLVGVNHYDDAAFPSLQYSAIDCQGLAEALREATQAFPQRTIKIHHDYAIDTPTLKLVRSSLREIVKAAQYQDTVLVYFSGYGALDGESPVLCLTDTSRDAVLKTGLSVAELLDELGQCAAKHQVVWLDACHSGGMTLRGMKIPTKIPSDFPNPTCQLIELLGQRAAQSQGFYALLSCDQSQQSWEFPELGHGVFTYFLMQGLRGEAADAKGTINADGLYKYVYHQTLQYIDKTNQQLRLINQQKRGRGEIQLQPEYPLQTPKRIVEGFGELVLGVRSSALLPQHPRQAIVVETFPNHRLTIGLSKIFRNAGSFELIYYPQPGKDWTFVRETIQATLHSTETTTILLYLRGKLEETLDGESWLVLGNGERLPRSWLRQELRRSRIVQHILILDCPGAISLADWVEDLRLESNYGQCIIAAASPLNHSDLLAQTLLATLIPTDVQTGLPVAAWITQLQLALAGKMPLYAWLSGAQGVIEVLPGQMIPRHETGYDLGLCPYRGLQAFTEEDLQYFYGREALTQRLLQSIQQQACLAVVGASGSGKSSVVQAGLVAQLRQGRQIPDSDRWWIGRMCPGDRPLDALVKAFSNHPDEQLQLEDLLHQGTEGFVQWLRTRPEPMIVLVVDQFEELFTVSPAEDQRRFLSLLLDAVKYTSDRFRLVFTLRADFISAGLAIPELAPMLQRSSIFVPPTLVDDEYRTVIVRPAEQVGLTVESGLVELLLNDLNRSPGNLPLLEFVLEQLWHYRDSGKLTLKSYQQHIGGLQGALERKAQAVYESLDPAAQDCARWIFLSLTQLGDNTEDTRRRILKSDLVVSKYPRELVDRTLQALSDSKLVVVNTDEGTGNGAESSSFDSSNPSVTIEVAHEILIRHWSTLRWWLDESRNRLRVQRQIEQATQQWTQHDRQTDFLLRGVRLAEAEDLYVNYTNELSQDIQQFIQAGLKERDREQIEAKRRLRRTQQVAATIGVLGVAATGFGGIALWNQRNAQIREIQALSSSSEALLNSNTQLESMVAALKAGRQLQRLDQPWNVLPQSLKLEAISTLQQAIARTQEANRLEAHSQQVNDITISPDGQTIATASDDNTAKLWSRDGQFLRDLSGHSDRVTAISFSSGSSLIATGSADKTVRIWTREGKLLQTLTGHTDWITDVRFNPKGQLLASASRDGTIKLWRLGMPVKELQTLRGHTGWVNRISFSPDGQQLASASEDGMVKRWQAGNDAAIATFRADRDRVTSVAFSPDGKQLATSGEITTNLWNTDGTLIRTLETHTEKVNAIQFSPNGQMIATGSNDRAIRLYDLEGKSLGVLRGHGAGIMQVSFSPDGSELFTASSDKTARAWRVEPARKSLNSGLSKMATSSDGKTVAIVNSDNTIKLFQREQNQLKPLNVEFKGHTSAVTQISFSPNGFLLASSSADKTIRLWEVRTGKVVKTITGHSDRVTSVAFRPDGKILASGSADKTIRLWSVPDATLVDTLKGHDQEVTALSFSPGGHWLVSGSHDNTIRLWYPDSVASIVLGRHKLAIAALTFSPDGKTLASASWDNTLKLWTIGEAKLTQEATPHQTLMSHNGGVLALSFSPNGQVLASGSDDSTVKLWDMATGQPLKTLIGANDRVESVLFSRDGQFLLSTSNNAGLLQWDLDLTTLLKQGCDRVQNYLKSKPEQANLCSE
jgi:WD40 repeat protein/uncharacterized caspase-like protein